MSTRPMCRDHGDANVVDCLGVADDRYTMDFTDVEEGAYIYWCSMCGPRAHAWQALLDKALDERPGFAEDLKREIDKRSPSA